MPAAVSPTHRDAAPSLSPAVVVCIRPMDGVGVTVDVHHDYGGPAVFCIAVPSDSFAYGERMPAGEPLYEIVDWGYETAQQAARTIREMGLAVSQRMAIALCVEGYDGAHGEITITGGSLADARPSPVAYTMMRRAAREDVAYLVDATAFASLSALLAGRAAPALRPAALRAEGARLPSDANASPAHVSATTHAC